MQAAASIRLITKEEADIGLLMEADPDEAMVRSYLDDSLVFEMREGCRSIGCLLLFSYDKTLMEIKNIAVAEAYRNKGHGLRLLQFAIEEARRRGAQKLKIATGNSSTGQLYLYQKAGFKITRIVEDYFTNRYPAPIVENGILCRHQVILEMLI